VPDDFEPNPLAALLARKREEGARILDLTVTNPTLVDLGVEGTELGARSAATYLPEPRGSRTGRAAVARYYAEREGRDVISPDRLVLTASTSESYAHLFRLLCNPDDNVLVPAPSYPLFEPLARLEGVEAREYPLRHGPDGWRVDLASLEEEAGPRSRAILLVQPNNPTGSCVAPEELLDIEAIAERRGLALVSDEVFGDFPWPPASDPLPSLLAGPRRVPTFVLGGISKLCGLPQMKLGWIAVTGPDPGVGRALEGLEWIADLFLSTSAPIEAALPDFLQRRVPFGAAVRGRLAANLGLLRRVASSGPFTLLETQGGWSAVLRRGDPEEPSDEDADTASGSGPAEELLEREGILVHPGHFYGLSDLHVVLSLIVEPSVLEEALDRWEATW
jgi:alanine-synthesizing transaminase